MKKLIYTLPLAILGCTLGTTLQSCSNDEMEPVASTQTTEDGTTQTEKFFIDLNVQLPSSPGTKNATQDTGNTSGEVKEGTDAENELISLKILLCKDNVIKATFATSTFNPSTNGATKSVRIEVTDEMSKFVELAGQNVQIIVVANDGVTETNIGHTFADLVSAADATFTVTNASFYGSGFSPVGKFGTAGKTMPFVSMAPTAEVTLAGGTLTTDEEKLAAIRDQLFTGHTTGTAGSGDSYTYPAGTVQLERAVARLEYKDNSPNGDNKFTVVKPGLGVKLYSMVPFNINNQSYLFRHISEGDYTKAGATVKVFGDENGGVADKYNWVASYDWTKTGANYDGKNTGSFINKLSINSDSYGVADKVMESVIGTDFTTNSEYKPWCYIPENTLPTIAMMNPDGAELSANATGVAFTFQILGRDGSVLEYSADRINYPSSISNSVTKGHTTDKTITITLEDGTWTDVAYVEGKGYLLTYIAHIIHNDGDKHGNSIAPMYNGVVRNNTYQMSILEIATIPFPQQKRSLYLELEIKVLPWNVRSNGFHL